MQRAGGRSPPHIAWGAPARADHPALGGHRGGRLGRALAIGIAVEPPPNNPNAVDPWFLNVLGTILLVALLSTFAGFWLRRRWSLAASLLASGLLVVSTLACPASGHHTQVRAWWVVQLGCGLGLVTASTLGLRRG
jgi:hypothetical protein